MASIRFLCFLLLAATCAAAAESRPATPHQRVAPAKPVAAKPVAKDAQLEANIRARFARSKIAADGFTVRVQGGVATLEGRTNVVQHKGTATRMAKSAGATAVNNRIQVSEAARAKAAANLEKGRRRAQVKRGDARSEATPPRQTR